MGDSAAQAAEVEAAFREVNETMTQERDDPHEQVTVYCECFEEICTEDIVFTSAEYERVRSEGRHFIVRPGHVDPSIETVVAVKNDRYWLIEKLGLAGEVAEESDPRS